MASKRPIVIHSLLIAALVAAPVVVYLLADSPFALFCVVLGLTMFYAGVGIALRGSLVIVGALIGVCFAWLFIQRDWYKLDWDPAKELYRAPALVAIFAFFGWLTEVGERYQKSRTSRDEIPDPHDAGERRGVSPPCRPSGRAAAAATEDVEDGTRS